MSTLLPVRTSRLLVFRGNFHRPLLWGFPVPRLKSRRGRRTPRPNWDMVRRKQWGEKQAFEDLIKANVARTQEIEALMSAATVDMLMLDGYYDWLYRERLGYWIEYPLGPAGLA